MVTLWYWAPEILLGLRNYDEKIDVWSLGCFFAELFIGKTLFPGEKEEQQIELILDVVGTPDQNKFTGYKYLKPIIKDMLERKTRPNKLV